MIVSLTPTLGNCSMRCARLLAPGAVLTPTSCRCTPCIHAVVSQREIRSARGATFTLRFPTRKVSTSMTNRASRQTKSAIYQPMGCCRRNFSPSSGRLRKCGQRERSASVSWPRSVRAFRAVAGLFRERFATWTFSTPDFGNWLPCAARSPAPLFRLFRQAKIQGMSPVGHGQPEGLPEAAVVQHRVGWAPSRRGIFGAGDSV